MLLIILLSATGLNDHTLRELLTSVSESADVNVSPGPAPDYCECFKREANKSERF